MNRSADPRKATPRRARPADPAETRDNGRRRSRRVRLGNVLSGFVLPLLLALVLFAGLVYFVFPTTTWLDQRAEASEANEAHALLSAEQVQLRADISRMRTDEEIVRLARRDFNLVFPGEEAYALLPAPPRQVTLPASWPFSLLYDEVLD